MAHTYIITNKGSTITDLSLKAVDPVTGLPARIFLKPSINHARLERGKTLKVIAYPLFDDSDMAIDSSGGLHSEIFDTGVFLTGHKREISALIKAEGAGNTKSANAEVQCPAGKNVYPVTITNQVLSCSSKDWYCTNRPDVTTIINTLPDIKAADIESATISLNITPQSNVQPHNGQVTLNSNKVGEFINSIPTGNMTFDLPAEQLNSGHYVSASEFTLDITVKSYTSHVCASSQEEANTIKPPLCEFLAAKLKEGVLEGNVLVGSNGMKLTNGGTGDTGECPLGTYCKAMNAVADPINTKTGSMSFTAADLSIPTSAGTLAFQRSYSSAATTIFTGTFGPGWTHNHDARLIFPDDANGVAGYVLFKSILGNLYYFKINDDGTYAPMPGVTAALTRDGQGDTAVYSIKSRAQTGFTFDAKGKALTRSDAQGNTFTYTYDDNGKLSRISADGGQRFIELTYDSQGRVATATDHAGRQVAYHYNPNGDLNDITDILGKTWSYLYDSAHRMTKNSNPDGVSVTTEYDMQGRAYRQFDGKGNQMVNIVYNADGSSTITDANGKTSKDVYDKLNTLSDSYDPLGGNTSTQRDTSFNPTLIKDPGGHTTGLVWSADGANLTQVTDAAGQTSSLTYDSFNNLTGVTDTAGHQTQYFYEDSSHPTLVTRIVDAQGTETSYQYDGNGRLIKTTDPLGHSTSYGYDSFGQRTSVTDALGHSTSSSYDDLGRMTDSTGIDGLTTHYEYDAAGHLIKSTRNYDSGRAQNDENLYNIVTTYEYNSVGNQTAVTDTLGATTRYEYDENNRLVKTIDPAGNATRSVYNAAGQLVESVDALSRSTSYTYDALGRVTVTTAPDGSTTRSEYNPDGTVAASIDASGARTTYIYDELKRTTAIRDAMGNETHTSYDAAGNVQSSTDAMGNVTSYEYDALGRVVNTTSPDGSVTHTEYNSAGQTVSTTRNYDAGKGQNDGNIYNLVTSYTYDELGRQKTVSDTLGNATTYNYDAAGRIHSVTDAMGRSTTYEYDNVGRQSAVIDSMGGRSSQSFDVLGRVTASTDMAGRTTSYAFDDLGRQTAVIDAAGGQVSYTYDAAGQRLSQTDANGHATTFTYDAAGRTLTTTDANGMTTTNEYGSGGRLLSVTNGSGDKTRYEYDALGRQTAVTDPLGNVTRYTYNANGQRVMMTDANGLSTQYGYDAAGRLTDVVENYVDGAPSDAQTNVHTHYAYDLNGSRTSITDGNGNVTTFEYDALGRQTAESDALGHTTRYTYNADGNRATQVDAMGRTTSFEYNARGQLTRVVYPSPDPAVVFSYNDATGQRVSMDDGIGRTTWNYDALGRVTSVTDPFGKTVAYEYDNVGNRTGLTYPDGKVVNYTYDPANRLQVVKDWLDQVTTYGYDSANRLNLVALPNGINSSYQYDSAGHLTNLTHAAQDRTLASYTYTYDATGNRTSAVEDMVTLEGKPPYVSVFVKDTDGNAVVGAPVYAFTGTKSSGKNAATNANGEARLTLPFGNYRFRVDIKDQTLGTNTGQFWSSTEDACVVEGCHKVFVTVNKPVTVSVADSSGLPQSGLTVYAYLNTPKTDGSGYTETYSGISAKTGDTGQASLVLPFGLYRFRADLNGTRFWSSPNITAQMCDVSQPAKVTALQDGAQGTRCTAAAIQVSVPFKVTVASTDGDLIKDTPVYAFTGNTNTGISAKTDANGEVTFTMPFGSYRFRADYKPEGAASATQFWSGASDGCTLPGCSGATVTVTKPFAVTVQDTDGQSMPNLAVYAFTGTTYTGYHGVTDVEGKVVFALQQGAYHFRADYNSTKFWSSEGDECVIPGCPASSITVTKPLTVSVTDTDGAAMPDISVYAFDGTTYKGYSKKTSASGQAVFTLPQGNYRFRADYNGTQFWSGAENHCTLPGCTGAGVTLTKPVIVTALDTNNLPAAGISLYAYSDTTYKGYSGKTSAGGQVSFTLPLGSYRFRGDYNGKKYWSSAGNDCALPGCSAASVKLGAVVPTLTPTVLAYIPTVVTDIIGGRRLAKPVDVRPRMDSASSGPMVVTVLDTDGTPLAGMPVYAFTGATYTGKHGVTNVNGQANIILPAGSYRFRSDRNGTRFWSSEADACTVPACVTASVTVTKPVTVTVRDTDGQPQAGIAVYAFDGTTYKSISGKTDANGSVSLTLPAGSYRFRGDLNGTKFWSSDANECVLPGCASAAITLTKPVTVTVKDTAGAPKEGLTVYAFDGTTYKSINGKTDANGVVILTLPQGAYRFRVDLNGTHFWSGADNHCALPGCSSVDVAVTIPLTVRVEGVDHSPFEGVKVYAFDGTTYKGYSGTSGKDGQVTFTLPQGSYRFRGDLNGTQFWSSTENACTLPGCASAAITLPGGNTSRSAVTINYTYDGLSRLTAADYSSGDYYHYAYDAVGNRLNETTTKGETAYTYDTANRLTSVNGQAVQWDDNGNMLADGQAVYTYNTANRLVGVTKGTSSILYTYSGLGDRLRQIADGVTTDYTLDINAGLTQVLQDNTNKYVYGNTRISQIAETQTGYFLPDALGSMRQMTDPSADLTLARAYDPYGNVVSSSGAGETVYGYTGEMQSGGLVHLRARDYASQLGRFTSRDTWEGNIKRPISLNMWNYVDSSPINLMDPTGNDPCNVDDPNDYRCHQTPTPMPTSTPASNKTAYLTFDDGPSINSIPIAQKLQEKGMLASFFVVGTDKSDDWNYSNWRVNLHCDANQLEEQSRPEWSGKPIVQYLSSLGNAIGIHAWYHPNNWALPGSQPAREIKWVEDQLKNSLGVVGLPQKLIRASGGNFGKIPYPGYENWFYYGWDVNSYDWVIDTKNDPNNAPQVIENLRSELEKKNFPDNAIILMHEVKPATTNAIVNGDLLGKLEEWGYNRFFPLPRVTDGPGVLIGSVE
jgi:RHS repeat-associated protein